MGILIVDDSQDELTLTERILRKAGYKNILIASSANEAFGILDSQHTDIDLILMDICMPKINGIEACFKIKEEAHLKDIPIVMVSAYSDEEKIHWAFCAGAVDYITKPVKEVELLARVNSIRKLKDEMDQRKAREKELEEMTRELETANKALERISMTDGLTGIANRRYFDKIIEHEWLRAVRDGFSLSLIFADVDYFKAYNDTYGHLAGDDCLRRVASALKETLKRPADMVARYGGEEFAVVLPETNLKGAVSIAEAMRMNVAVLGIPHRNSKVLNYVTISLGVASTVPRRNESQSELIVEADRSLYEAKKEGRNQVRIFEKKKAGDGGGFSLGI
ncbi:MAG: diguanylate cyclase [Candidatus Brocadia sp.]|nr:diguanylate cyclase [Candidatus Brocadia sp.]